MNYNEAEAKKFETATRSIARQCRKLAASTDGHWGPLEKSIARAIDRAQDLCRFLDDPETSYAVCNGLIAARRFAGLQSAANLKAARYAEIARLDKIIREKKLEARINNGW